MSFTYNFTTQPLLSQVRLLIMDTDSSAPIFDDDEVNQFIYMTSSQAIYQSGQANPTGTPVSAPTYAAMSSARMATQPLAGERGITLSVPMASRWDRARSTSTLRTCAMPRSAAITDSSGQR